MIKLMQNRTQRIFAGFECENKEGIYPLVRKTKQTKQNKIYTYI